MTRSSETWRMVGMDGITVLSLFSGIGGLDLGIKISVSRARTVLYCEKNAFRRGVLERRMRDGWLDEAPVVDCVELVHRPPRVDLVLAGYPCQWASGAARGRNNQPNLFFHVERIATLSRARLVFLENVVLDQAAVRSLERLGYDVRTKEVAASDVGAPHVRPRVFTLGCHADCEGESVGALDVGEVAELPESADSHGSPWGEPRGDLSVVDGVSAGVDSRAAYGDAVAPLVAAYAFHTLAEDAGLLT